MKNIPVLSFIQRTWWLLAFAILANYLTIWSHVWRWVPGGYDEWGNVSSWRGLTTFDILGPVLYIPSLAMVAVWVSLFITHLYFRNTMDKDAHDGTYIADWQSLTPAQRVNASVALRIGIIIAVAIIAAGIAK